MSFRLITIDFPEPLRTVVLCRQHIRGGRKLHRPTIDTGLRIKAKREIERSTGAAHSAQRYGTARAVPTTNAQPVTDCAPLLIAGPGCVARPALVRATAPGP